MGILPGAGQMWLLLLREVTSSKLTQMNKHVPLGGPLLRVPSPSTSVALDDKDLKAWVLEPPLLGSNPSSSTYK